MDVQIVTFPETRVAVLEHLGPPEHEHQSIMRLVAWRRANQLPPSPQHRSYGLHYNDPFSVPPEEYRLDLCVSFDGEVAPNEFGVIGKTIPELRCARARHLGSRHRVTAADHLYSVWLPRSGEQMADYPIIFHYVNVGPDIKEPDMITDVYLPLA
ncbi:GyrI-like domain-containing protein [uncultured Microbulbifer sp.]|uniref:AraC family transcriptional regulator n=1 Tax=uncultured Microbulbifer sp. TaxID=348147 RepID=UPI0025D605F6|nr:GyrI-like domain-containing protein [uncultured Microbulbifer sp.]